MSSSEWGTFKEALMLLASRNIINAEDALDEAIVRRKVRRRGKCVCDERRDGRSLKPVEKYRTQDWHSQLRINGCEINLHDVATWAHSVAGNTGIDDREERRGPKVRIDWDAFWLAVCSELFENGFAKNQSEFIKRVDVRLGGIPDRAKPGKTEFEKRISRVYKELGSSR